MPIRTYSVADDTVKGAVVAGQLFLEIEKNVNFTTVIHAVNVSGDTITVQFETALPENEDTILDGIIAAHIPREFRNFIPIVFQPVMMKNKEYETALSFFINGTKNEQGLHSVKIVSKKNNGSGSYSIRLYDSTNDKILFENTYTNTSYEMLEIDTFSDIPEEEAILEIQVKVTSVPCYIKACKVTN